MLHHRVLISPLPPHLIPHDPAAPDEELMVLQLLRIAIPAAEPLAIEERLEAFLCDGACGNEG
jgi:hypothetical protein